MMLDLDLRIKMLPCIYSKKLLNKLYQINIDLNDEFKINIQEIEKAIIYAKYYHGDQKRDSGEPYYSHPLEVAYMVSDHLPKTDIIITAILHDTIEDTILSKDKIAEVFGTKIAEQVSDLTRIKADGVKISSAQMLEELWIEKKKDLLLIKLFDRLHNMQTIEAKSSEKRQKISKETLNSFILLPACLTNQTIEDELIKLLSFLHIKQYKTKNLLIDEFLQSPDVSQFLAQVFETYSSQNNTLL